MADGSETAIDRRRDAVPHLPKDRLSGPLVDLVIRLGALGLLLYWAIVLVSPFVSILIWSIVLAVALYPAFDRLTRWLGGRPRLAAVLITIVTLLIVIGPATWLALVWLKVSGSCPSRSTFRRLRCRCPPRR